ncbi:ATP-binding cassette domain-containing protein [Leptospira sp. 96542]|nr:ATP-binding cassette domain-containing protein [Leptospira sp. 96542]
MGRNGTGKSSLLKVLAGLEKLDDGELQLRQGLRLAYVPQEPVFAPSSVSVLEASTTPAIAWQAKTASLPSNVSTHCSSDSATSSRSTAAKGPGSRKACPCSNWRAAASTGASMPMAMAV